MNILKVRKMVAVFAVISLVLLQAVPLGISNMPLPTAGRDNAPTKPAPSGGTVPLMETNQAPSTPTTSTDFLQGTGAISAGTSAGSSSSSGGSNNPPVMKPPIEGVGKLPLPLPIIVKPPVVVTPPIAVKGPIVVDPPVSAPPTAVSVTAETLPAVVVADQAKVTADSAVIKAERTTLMTDEMQLVMDEAAKSTAVLASDKAKVKADNAQISADRVTLRADEKQLVTDAQPIVSGNLAALQVAARQLATDEKAQNTTALAADRAALAKAEAQLRADYKAIWGPTGVLPPPVSQSPIGIYHPIKFHPSRTAGVNTATGTGNSTATGQTGSAE